MYLLSDTFLVDFEEEIVIELTEKANNLYVEKRLICPALAASMKVGVDFQLVSNEFWHKILERHNAGEIKPMQTTP